MFKNLNIFRIAQDWSQDLTAMESALQAAQFVPCGPTQDKSVGWVPPRGESHGALVESINGHHIMRLRIETKSVPGTVLRKKAQEAADRIEHETGRKPGKKKMRVIKDDALLALLPNAYPKQSDVLVWIDPASGLLCTDASTNSKNDEAITALLYAFNGLKISMLQTNVSPQDAISKCEGMTKITVDKAHVLFDWNTVKVAPTAAKGEYQGGTHAIPRLHDRRGHWRTYPSGKVVWVKNCKVGDASRGVVFKDYEVSLATGELKVLIPALVEAMGGELAMEGGAA